MYYYGNKLDHTLINPNQLRAYGISLWDNPFDPIHSLAIEVNPTLNIPLRAYGTKVGFCTHVPTAAELRTCEHIQMTSVHPWNPSEVVLAQATVQGGNRLWKRRLESPANACEDRSEYLDVGTDEELLNSIDPSLAHIAEELQKRYRMLQIETHYDQLDAPACRTFVSDEQYVKVSAELIAERVLALDRFELNKP
jgi:hypothetical protein